jgi:hypothetical protein
MRNEVIRTEQRYISSVPVYLENIHRPVLVSQLFLDLLKGIHFRALRWLLQFALTTRQSPLVVKHIPFRQAGSCMSTKIKNVNFTKRSQQLVKSIFESIIPGATDRVYQTIGLR